MIKNTSTTKQSGVKKISFEHAHLTFSCSSSSEDPAGTSGGGVVGQRGGPPVL